MAEQLPVPMPVPGETLGPLEIVVSQERVLAYARASGDHNPLHVDASYAAGTDFGGPVAHGMLLLAYLSRLLSRRFGLAWAENGNMEARFRAPAMVGTTIIARGSVESVERSPDEQRIECQLSCEDAAGQTLVTAKARLRVST